MADADDLRNSCRELSMSSASKLFTTLKTPATRFGFMRLPPRDAHFNGETLA